MTFIIPDLFTTQRTTKPELNKSSGHNTISKPYAYCKLLTE